MCKVTIFDENGKPMAIEVTPEIYEVFIEYDREMERQRKADFRHLDFHSWDTGILLGIPNKSLEKPWEQFFVIKEIEESLTELTPKQYQRFVLHFIYGYTYREIAEMEGNNKATVMRSVKAALKKIRKKLTTQ